MNKPRWFKSSINMWIGEVEEGAYFIEKNNKKWYCYFICNTCNIRHEISIYKYLNDAKRQANEHYNMVVIR